MPIGQPPAGWPAGIPWQPGAPGYQEPDYRPAPASKAPAAGQPPPGWPPEIPWTPGETIPGTGVQPTPGPGPAPAPPPVVRPPEAPVKPQAPPVAVTPPAVTAPKGAATVTPVKSSPELNKAIADYAVKRNIDIDKARDEFVDFWQNPNKYTEVWQDKGESLRKIAVQGGLYEHDRTPVTAISETGEKTVILVSNKKLEDISRLSDKEQFEALQELGIYPTDYGYTEWVENGKQLGGILIGKDVEAQTKQTKELSTWLRGVKEKDPEGYKVYLKTANKDGPDAGDKALSEFRTKRFEDNLHASDKEGWKVYEQAGKGDKGLKAYDDYLSKNFVQSPATGEWLDKGMMQELQESDPELHVVFMEKGYDKGVAAMKDAEARIEKARQNAVDKAIREAEAEAKAEPIKERHTSVETHRVVENYKKAETAFIEAMDRIDSDNPSLSATEKTRLYEALPEYKAYSASLEEAQNNRDAVSDVLAEVLSPEFSQWWNPMTWKKGTIPTQTFNREQLGKMYEDNVKITLAIYAGDTAKLKSLYESGAFGEFTPSIYDDAQKAAHSAYFDAITLVTKQDSIKRAVAAGDLNTLDAQYKAGDFGDDKAGYEELRQYVESGGRALAPITATDIKAVKASLGSKEDYMVSTAKAYPSGYALAKEVGISMVPILGTIHNWDKMGAGGKAFSIVTDALVVWPFFAAAARAGRTVSTAVGMGSRLKLIGKAVGREAIAQVVAPVDIILHPVATAKTVGRGVRDIAEVITNPGHFSEWVLTTSDKVTRIRFGKDLSQADAMKAVNELTRRANINGNRIIVEYGGKQIEIPRSALMKELGGGMAHASPDIEKLLKSGRIIEKEGLPVQEQGLFLATEAPLEFTSGAAFGKGTVPVAKGATETVYDISKYRIESLVKIDKAPVRPLDFANAKNVPEDLAREIQKYTRQHGGVLYGSMNEYTKIKKAARPNDLDLAFSNQAKATDDIEGIANKLGYNTRRKPHAIEVFDDGEWKQIADIANIEEHKARTLPKGLSHSALTTIDGIRTETMGEQYLRQSIGAVSKTEKASQRAARVNAAAKEVKKMLQQAGAEKRQPGVFVESPEHAAKSIPTEKTYYGAEVETKHVIGNPVIAEGRKISDLQHFYSRHGPRGERFEIYLEKPLTNVQILKLKAKGIIEMLKAPFQQQIKITSVGKAAASTGKFTKDMDVLEDAIRGAGNIDEANAMRRVIKSIRSTQRAPGMVARATSAGILASQLGRTTPARADEIDDEINLAYEAEGKGKSKEADNRIKGAKKERDVLADGEGRPRIHINMMEAIRNIDLRALSYRKTAPTEAELRGIIASVSELRDAAERGQDVRPEASELVLKIRREFAKDLRDKQLKTLPRMKVVPKRFSDEGFPRKGFERPSRGRITIPQRTMAPELPRQGRVDTPPRTPTTPERTPRVPDYPPRTPRSPRVPPPLDKTPRARFGGSDSQRREFIKNAGGAIAFNMGEVGAKGNRKRVWDVIIKDYAGNEDHLQVLGRPPEGATIIKKGKGSAYATAQMLTGEPPKKEVDIDKGIMDINLKADGRRITAQFKADPHQLTKGDITIGRPKTQISEHIPPISDHHRVRISRGKGIRITQKMPRLR